MFGGYYCKWQGKINPDINATTTVFEPIMQVLFSFYLSLPKRNLVTIYQRIVTRFMSLGSENSHI